MDDIYSMCRAKKTDTLSNLPTLLSSEKSGAYLRCPQFLLIGRMSQQSSAKQIKLRL